MAKLESTQLVGVGVMVVTMALVTFSAFGYAEIENARIQLLLATASTFVFGNELRQMMGNQTAVDQPPPEQTQTQPTGEASTSSNASQQRRNQNNNE